VASFGGILAVKGPLPSLEASEMMVHLVGGDWNHGIL